MRTCWAGLDLMEQDWRIKKCSRCKQEIVWLKSARTGKNYPVDFKGVADVIKSDFHKCGRR